MRLLMSAYLLVSRSSVNMLDFLKKISWANVFKYASEILVANEFNGLTFECRNQSSKCNNF